MVEAQGDVEVPEVHARVGGNGVQSHEERQTHRVSQVPPQSATT